MSAFGDRDTDDAEGILEDVSTVLQDAQDSIRKLRRKAFKRVMMSGCIDLMHSGHVACFEEASKYGDLYMCLGNDKNITLLKHPPTIPEEERKYMVQAVRHVHETRISSGSGDLDWLSEIDDIKPDIFFVNEDGDRPAKREACAKRGVKYVVGKRKPAKGLTARSSTALKKTVAAQKASAEVVQPSVRPKFIYFNGRGKADPVRFVLEAAGLEYDDVFLTSRQDFLDLIDEGTLDFSQVPVLQINGHNLVQTRAIIGFIADSYGLNGPSDLSPLQKYQLEEVYQGSQDFRSKFVGAPFALNRMPAEEMLQGLTEHFNKWLPLLEKLLKRVGPSPFCCGITLSYADVVLFESLLFATEIRGAYSKEDAETQLSQFPTVFALFSAVKGLPRIQKYLQSPRRIPVPVFEEATRYTKEVNIVLGREC